GSTYKPIPGMKASLFRWIADFRGSFVKGRPYASLHILIQRVTDAPDLYAEHWCRPPQPVLEKSRRGARIAPGATPYVNPLYGPVVRKCNIQISDRIRHLI